MRERERERENGEFSSTFLFSTYYGNDYCAECYGLNFHEIRNFIIKKKITVLKSKILTRPVSMLIL